jgi:hypothetical protein
MLLAQIGGTKTLSGKASSTTSRKSADLGADEAA